MSSIDLEMVAEREGGEDETSCTCSRTSLALSTPSTYSRQVVILVNRK